MAASSSFPFKIAAKPMHMVTMDSLLEIIVITLPIFTISNLLVRRTF